MAPERELTDSWLATETKFTDEKAPELLETRLVGLTVLWHPDPERVGERAELAGLGSGRRETLARHEPLFAKPGSSIERPLADEHLSRRPIGLEPSGDGVCIDASATRTPVEIDGLALVGRQRLDAERLEAGSVLLLGRHVVLLLHRFDPLTVEDPDDLGMIGSSDAMVETRRAIHQVANSDLPVLLRGESGTGKELAAAAIHRSSRRRRGAFISVNMAAVPPTLAAAELFGSSRGAFTGADSARRGFFRQAEGGTLFLDEIGETPPEVQPLLLRALESGEVQALGASRAEVVDVRVIAATDMDLESATASGDFRLPLFHRLAAYTVHLPPLARRHDDFGRLLLHFLEVELEAAEEPHHGLEWLPAGWVAELARRRWPGNIRQLRNAARRLVVRSRGRHGLQAKVLDELLDELDLHPVSAPPHEGGGTEIDSSRRPAEISLEDLETALEAEAFRPEAAARRLGISRPSLYDLMAKHPEIRSAGEIEPREISEALEAFAGDAVAAARSLRVSKLGLMRRLKALGLK